ncbi:RNA polymerase subunit sigma-70 [Pendulispora albinea]|uniref:RNA polymerase subunit sigma-70 n=1 Tax=Pendulispora albinea TaxID=2741071 RepID=A0ABZ2LVE6_9BACT
MQDKPDGSFFDAVEPLRGALRLHCYRMLGSSHDGDDMVQETMLRAWRARESLDDPGLLRPWLYRIATNVCLDELKSRPRRMLVSDTCPPMDPLAPFAPAIDEPIWLEPVPDTWLGSARDPSPAARYTLKESVALAFVAALQLLPPAQRATLLLRDVVGLSAEETASALGLSVGAANSALFRARTAVEQRLGGRDVASIAASTQPVDEALLARYVRAFEDSNIEALVALLHADVKTTMPPAPMWLDGRAANEAFFRKMFSAPKWPPGGLRVLRIGANAQSAFAFYHSPLRGEPVRLHAIDVIDVRHGVIVGIHHFMMQAVFPLFGLPAELPATPK